MLGFVKTLTLLQARLAPDMAIYNSVLRMMFHAGAAPAELEAYAAATGQRPDRQMFCALLHAYARERDLPGAAGAFERMHAAGARAGNLFMPAVSGVL